MATPNPLSGVTSARRQESFPMSARYSQSVNVTAGIEHKFRHAREQKQIRNELSVLHPANFDKMTQLFQTTDERRKAARNRQQKFTQKHSEQRAVKEHLQ